MKTYYFYKNQIIYCETIPNHKDFTFNDRFGNFVTLTDTQVEFYLTNPTATVIEVYNCALTPIPEPDILTNEQIRVLRQQAYKDRSDAMYIAWQKYMIQGLEERAEQAEQEWLEEVEKIDLEFPYITE